MISGRLIARSTLAMLILCLCPTVGIATPIIWQGNSWDFVNPPTAVSVSPPDTGALTVTTMLPPGWAKFIPVGGTDFFEITADMDTGPQSVVMVADYTPNQGAQIFVDPVNQQIGYDDYDDGIGGVSFTFVPTVLPTSGLHTYRFTKGADDLITIDLDGSPLWTAPPGIEVDTMTDLFAGAYIGTGVFTTYAIPEPSTVVLLSLGLAGLALRRRRSLH